MGPPKYKINQSIYVHPSSDYNLFHLFCFVFFGPPSLQEMGSTLHRLSQKLRWFLSTLFIYHVLSRSICKPLIFNSHVSSMCPKSKKKRNKINSQAKWYFIRLVSFRSPSHLQQPQKAPDNDRSIKTEMKRNIIDRNATLTIFSVYYKKKEPCQHASAQRSHQ